ncbi:HAMP domain-containing histidine kinase [Sphingobacterium sp. SRCM116780]|uniref:sensor histidine kinase n=1 Tax=Sphingobacterium sp. SRCM116780 TaxID=2907623 RepID=UPI001F262A82|nr:HAMP domain-containing sensor histidine kinase [Sphingobacterium sp. SRCM116780]UIR57355.1 HAMP domain-containing histidine kinase [Sphingobacterium sp. SRCM116780]
MKPLLNKTTRPFLLYVLIILGISVPVYFVIIDGIWKNELDEHNKIVAKKTAHELNKLNLSPDKLQASIALWNIIQPGTNIRPVATGDALTNRVYTQNHSKSYDKPLNIDRFRCLSTVIYLNKQPYRFIIETNIEESQETMAAIAGITLFFFLLLVVGLLLLTRKLSNTVWKPFQNTVEKLKTFNLNNQTPITFEKTDIIEFHDLNQSLNKLITQNISVYKTQKEFTENASHELQTPLAILKNKLDILLQNKDLTTDQYQIVEDMHKALTRSTRLNKNLLLLAKIENSQFDQSESIQFDQILQQSIDILQEHMEQKNIQLHTDIQPQIVVLGNSSLTDILINNLLLNAIRHTPANGQISIALDRSSFTVSNTGEKELDSEMLFKRFSKLAKNNNGSGLGLAIITQICYYQRWKVQYAFQNKNHFFSIHF